VDLQLIPDTELLEAVCSETERFSQSSKGSKISATAISPNVLSTFVGTYEVGGGPAPGLPFGAGGAFVVTLADDQ
jgi:hypothetical protein